MFVSETQQARQDVWEYSTAARGRGAAEEGGEHQEDLGQSGCGGYQGETTCLVRARARGYRLTPRLVFTNDITFQGQAQQF